MLRDNLGRFARSGFMRKTTKLALISGSIWFLCHLFTASYAIHYNNGIYGIVAKDTYNSIQEAFTKADAYDTIPYNYSTQYVNYDYNEDLP